MRIWIKRIVWVLFFVGVIVLVVRSCNVHSTRSMDKPKIVIHVKGEDAFLTEDDFRLFYAAFDNDVLLMQSLNILGWHVSFTGHICRAAHQADSLPAPFRSGQHRRL
jgi:hypothetical protein